MECARRVENIDSEYKMKRIAAIILTLMIAVSVFSGCNSNTDDNSGKFNIICTIYPEYDWVKNLTAGAKNVETTLLLDGGVDMHSYQPTVSDIVKISTCDMFIFAGGESDTWVEDALSQAINTDMVVINLLDILGDRAKEEEEIEGMKSKKGEEDESELDEHVWLSLKNAEFFCEEISDKLIEADSANKPVYEKNLSAYKNNLDMLDKKYRSGLSNTRYDTLIFCDRFPFRYLVDDYGLKYYAAFSGCSAENGVGFETVVFLSEKLDELGVPAVITVDGSDSKVADTVISASHSKSAKVLTLNSMQSEDPEKPQNGDSYLAIMENNLEVLKKALN